MKIPDRDNNLTYRELGLHFGEGVASNTVGDLKVGVGLLGQDTGALLCGGKSQGRDGEGEQKGSLEVHGCGKE